MPAGRPRQEIDWNLVQELALIQCTQQEIASVLGVCINTLRQYPQFLTVYEKGQQEGKKSLRRMQYDKAKDGNVTMLIWLGKQYLGQSDKQELKEMRDSPEKVLEELEQHRDE